MAINDKVPVRKRSKNLGEFKSDRRALRTYIHITKGFADGGLPAYGYVFSYLELAQAIRIWRGGVVNW